MDEKSYYGVWWQPDEPDLRMKGTLEYNENYTISLKLNGVMKLIYKRYIEQFDEDAGWKILPNYAIIPIILGETGTKQKITLINCYMTHIDSSSDTATVTPKSYIVGGHFSSYNQLKFESWIVTYQNLTEWIESSAPQYYPEDVTQEAWINASHHMFLEKQKRDEKLIYDSSEFKVFLLTRLNSSRSVHGFNVTVKDYFKVLSNKPLDIPDIQQNINQMREFVSLLSGNLMIPEQIFLLNDVEEELEFHLIHRGVELKDRRFILDGFSFNYVETHMNSLMQNWFDKYQKLQNVVKLLFDLYFSEVIYAYLEFLVLMQAIETYHREVKSSTYVDSDLYKAEIRPKLVNALSKVFDELDEDVKSIAGDKQLETLKDSVGRVLIYSNEFSLDERLRDILTNILSEYKVLVDKIIDSDIDSFVKRAKNTRNYLTHYSISSPKWTLRKTNEQVLFSRKLQVLLLNCLFHEMGLDREAIVDGLQQKVV